MLVDSVARCPLKEVFWRSKTPSQLLDIEIKTQTGMVEQINKLLKTEVKKLDDLIKAKMELENGVR